MRLTFTLLFLFLATVLGLSQPNYIQLKNISTQQGLSNNQITCTIRDRQGFVWIGTKDGLNRFDGNDFYIFKHSETDSFSICGNTITCLELDNDSLLWIGTTSSGMCSYNFRTGKFLSYNISNAGLNSNNINDIAFDKNRNCLWIAQNNAGLQLFDLKSKSTNKKQNLISKNTYYDVLVNDTIPYFAGIIESCKRLGNIGKFRTKLLDTAQTINKFYIASNKLIYCGAWDNGLHQFNLNGHRTATWFFDGSQKLKKSGEEIISLVEDENNVLWCGTKSSGILLFDLKSKSFKTNIKFSVQLKSRINNLYRDNNNRIWIATETGLYVYDPLQNQIETTKLPIPVGINSCKVNNRLITDNGKEYIISQCGLFYKNAADKQYTFKSFSYRNEKLELTSMFADDRNVIYIGTNRALFILDTTKIELNLPHVNNKLYSHKMFFFGGSRINSITQISHNQTKLIAASEYGNYIHLIDQMHSNAYMLLKDKTKAGIKIENLSRKLFYDSKNTLWICGATLGINKITLNSNVAFNCFPNSDTIVRAIFCQSQTWNTATIKNINSVNNVYDMLENVDGTYWVSTQGHGLLKFSPNHKTVNFQSFSGEIKSLQGLAKDDKENLWIITSAGLLHYNVSANHYKMFDANSGVSENISGYFFLNNQSKPHQVMSAGFDGGFISFYPSTIKGNSEKPEASITRLWVMDVAADSLLNGKLHLNYKQNFLKFHIAANSFSDNGQTSYKYFLEGIDDVWRNNQYNALITYTNLPAGNFVLNVKAINSDGIESNVYKLAILIKPPFYNTWWFYGLVLSIIVAVVNLIYRYRIRQLLKLQEMRNKIARDLHDDIGSTLGSIHLYSQIANAKLNNAKPDEVKDILIKIENSSSEIIDKTGDVVWAVKATNDTLKNLVMRMESYAASILGTTGISFSVDIDTKLDNVKLDMTQRKNIFLIYKEAINNIIKYAACSEVQIKIKQKNAQWCFVISDNGKGFNLDVVNAYNGNGLKNMKARAEEIKGNFKIVSEPGKGTLVELII